MAVQTQIGMPMDEFIRLYDEAPFELVNGERIPLVPPVAEHGEVIRILLRALFAFEQLNPNFVVYTEMPVVLEDTPNWVKGSRVPDLMVYDKARFEAYKARTPDWKAKPFVLIPDLCVEVVSATDSYVDVEEKVDGYLRDGVRLVLVINPRQQTITARTPTAIMRLTADQTLDGGDVLPGFSLPIQSLFAE